MNGYSHPDLASDRVRREAADWLVLLRSSQRSPQMEAEFQAWLHADRSHLEAFFSVTRTWELMGAAGEELRVEQKRRRLRDKFIPIALAASIAIALGAWFGTTPAQTFETARGERRTVVLADGTRLSLNTETKVLVRYLPHRRWLQLLNGEAAFDVARDHARPFTVKAAGESVRAVGTSFTVRYLGPGSLDVILAEGQLELAPTASAAKTRPLRMTAGQGWSPQRGVHRLGPSELQSARAWQRGEVVFDGDTLQEAVAEMNRYSVKPIVLDIGGAAEFKVDGIYRVEDGSAFARSLGAIYDLEVRELNGEIRIVGRPRAVGSPSMKKN